MVALTVEKLNDSEAFNHEQTIAFRTSGLAMQAYTGPKRQDSPAVDPKHQALSVAAVGKPVASVSLITGVGRWAAVECATRAALHARPLMQEMIRALRISRGVISRRQ